MEKEIECKFCNGVKKNVYKQIGYTRKGNAKYGYAEVTEYPDFGETCKLTIRGNHLCVDYAAYSCDSSFNDSIEIKFCPMCGRKL